MQCKAGRLVPHQGDTYGRLLLPVTLRVRVLWTNFTLHWWALHPPKNQLLE